MVEKKKKKELPGSWIDEILGGKSDPLASVLREEKKEEKPSLPFISGGSMLEGILGSLGKEKESKPASSGNPLEEILKSSKEKPTPSSPKDIRGGGPKPSKESPRKDIKKTTPTGVDLLGQILGGAGASTTQRKPQEPAPQISQLPIPKPKPSLGLQSIIGETKPEGLSYGGRAKVLDAYGNVRILKVKGEPVPIYEIRLPKLSRDEENLLKHVRERAITEIQIDPTLISNYEERRKIFLREVKRMLKEAASNFSEGRIEVLAELIVQSMLGYGLLDPLVRDDNLEEIMVIGTNKPVYVWHRRFYMCKTNIVFKEERDILNIIERIAREVGRRIDQQNPLLDARLPDGSRVNATIPPISLDGPTITIRKFKKDPLTIIDLMKYGTLNSDVAAFLWLLVDGLGVKPANILVAGGTGSGKTTTLNALAMFIPPSERVISIEDTAELQLPVEHWVRLETRPPNIEGKGEVTMDDLVKNTLRMRPDRIIVGEVRGPEARTMFTAMNTGHDGALSDFSVLQLPDGRFVLIGDLLEELFQKYSNRIETYKDLEYIVLDEEDRFEVVSVGPDLKAGRHVVSRVWRRKVRPEEKLLHVRTRTGNEVVLTKTHPFFVFSEGNVIRKEAKKLKPGDRVAVMRNPSRLPQRKAVINPEIYAGISDYYPVPNGKGLMKIPNDGIPPEKAQYLLSINSKPVKVVHEVNESLSYVLGVIVGDDYISSEGCHLSATFDDSSYMNAFTSAISEFLPESEPQSGGESSYTAVTYGSQIFSELLHRTFGTPKGGKNNLDVPDLVLSNDELLRHFIAGLFDADAYVDEKDPAIILTTRSENLARKIWYALQRLGIISTVSRGGNRGYKEGVILTVTVRGVENLTRFNNLIPLRHSRKRAKLEKILRKYKSHREKRTDGVLVSPSMLEPIRKRLNLTIPELARLASHHAGEKVSESLIKYVEKGRMREIKRSALRGIALALQEVAGDLGDEEAWVQAKRLELVAGGDVYWDEVVSVEEISPEELGIEYLYDLTVEDDHNYVANGILVSNCMGTIHSNSARETIVRLESPPMNVPRIMIPALDIILMQVRFNSRKKGTVRRVTEIAEISGIEGESIQLNKLYKYDPAKDELQATEVPSRIINELARHTGMSISELEAEKEKRKIILEWMMERGIRSIEEVGHYIKMFYIDEDVLLEKIEHESSTQIQEQIRNIT